MSARVEDAARERTEGMRWLDGGEFSMGCERFYPEERPRRTVQVEGFWIDRHPVTVRQFARFVRETGYRTIAERPPDAAAYPDADVELIGRPGSLVFAKQSRPVALDDIRRWWSYVTGADWRHPEGPASGVAGRQRHPVTHVAYADAAAYARWAGRSLPSEAQWEYAARGGLADATYSWGEEPRPGGRLMANTWQGEFPWRNLKANGYEGTSPVGTFPPNGFGLYDMTGNVWEWTADLFEAAPAEGCCAAGAARALGERHGHTAVEARAAMHVIKGGSFLCAPNYCLRYRPAARQGETADTSTCHLGFRCVVNDDGARG